MYTYCHGLFWNDAMAINSRYIVCSDIWCMTAAVLRNGKNYFASLPHTVILTEKSGKYKIIKKENRNKLYAK